MKVQRTGEMIFMQSVLPKAYSQAFDMSIGGKDGLTMFNPVGPRAFNGNVLLKAEEGVIATVNPGHSVSVFFKPKMIPFRTVTTMMATNGYLCLERPRPLLCGKMLEDLSILRAFYAWGTASNGKIFNVEGEKMTISSRSTGQARSASVKMEFLKKVTKQWNKEHLSKS
jgi:hypothetical protein